MPHVYAVGDVNGRTALAHSAAAQARVAVGHALGENVRMDFSLIPVCVYTQPEITSVGLTEEEARAGGRQVLTGSCPMRSVGRAVAMGELEGFVKLVADAETGRILGGVIAGGQASELIAALTVALKLGATARDLAAVPFAHPTLSEAIAKAARQLLARRLLWL